jgi:DNA-binding NtrC family response regulator
MKLRRVLVIDDELALPAQAAIFARQYGVDGFTFEFCGSFADAKRRAYWTHALVLLDIRFEGDGDEHGIQILKEIRQYAPTLPVVMLSSRTAPDTLIRCWDEGAQGYIVKWTANRRFKLDLRDKLRRHARRTAEPTLLGESASIRGIRQTLATLADYDISVLILGETGSGKELVACSLHEEGKRAEKPFVALNCGAIPESLIESELFGHVRGAFTGATADHPGKIEEASGGTLFLDEIAELPAEMQVKLLRFLDSGEFTRVGENKPRRSKVRVVAATNRDLHALVAERVFREDLYYRLDGFKILLPSLRERAEDIPILAQRFLEQFRISHPEKQSIDGFSAECMKTLQAHTWPGNVRELRNAVERAAILSSGPLIEIEALPESVTVRSERTVQNLTAQTGRASGGLPEDTDNWPRTRLAAEIELAIEAKRHVQTYKRGQWKAEFMRLMYPHCKAANAKGFDDLIKRLKQGPWGDPAIEMESRLSKLLAELES